MPHTQKQKKVDAASQVLAGFQMHLASMSHIMLQSVTYTPAQLLAALQTLVALRAAVEAAQAMAKAKLVTEEQQAPPLHALLAAIIAYVQLTFGASPDILADFGLAPKKVRAVPTAAEKAVANEKRKATRAARGIVPRKVRMAIVGKVVGVTMTPVLAGAPITASPETKEVTPG